MTKNILVVDDNIELRDMLVELLEIHGFKCLTKDCGKDAVDFLKENSVDLIVCDLFMPNGDGTFVLNELKRTENKTPTIISTGNEDDSMSAKLLSLGAVKIFKKPYPLKKIISDLNEVLDKN